MASVRDSLKGAQPKSDSLAQQEDLGVMSPPDGEDHQQGMSAGASDAELIAERLRFAADQRAAFAQSQINRLEVQIGQIREMMGDQAKQPVALQQRPAGDLKAELEDAELRLDEAKADLVRAHEARQNTDITASLSQRHHEAPALQQHEHQGHELGSGGAPKVRDLLGKSNGPANAVRGPSKKLR